MTAKPDLAQQEGYYTERWNQFAFANQRGLGERGLFRLVNSPKVANLLGLVGARKLWANAGLRGMYGLHLVTYGQKSRRG